MESTFRRNGDLTQFLVKRNKHKCSNYVAIFIMTSQILKFEDLTKTQKSKYLQNEIINYTSRATLLQKIVL